MALEAEVHKHGIERVILEEHPEGIYVFVIEDTPGRRGIRDYLQDTWELAKEFCQEELHIGDVQWVEIPDTKMA